MPKHHVYMHICQQWREKKKKAKEEGKLLYSEILNHVSNNTGPVNPFFSTPLHALREERHFALVEKIAIPTKGSLVISFRSGSRSDPCISSVHNLDHDC